MQLKQFLAESYTSFHAVNNVVKYLQENGFSPLELGTKWSLNRQGKYFVTKNGSAVIAFVVGKNNVFSIVESHTDSPSFHIKGGAVVKSENVCRLDTEAYGGGIYYSFFDRQLKIAGRVLVDNGKEVEQKLVESNFNVVIPSLCIHHNPTVNEGVALNAQNDTLPIVSLGETDLYKALGVSNVLDSDLYVVPATEPFFAGVENELICSPRLDNLTSVYSSVNALVGCKADGIAVCACFDNEEVGSGTRQGGGSRLLEQVLQNIAESLNFSQSDYDNAIENGFVLSVDNGHAVHPAHGEKSDPVVKAHLGDGVVVKHHVNYATDGLSSALFKKILKDNDVKYQDYYNRSDVRCGSTIGLMAAKNLSMRVCDVGLAQLAMHSACETLAVSDVEQMIKGLTAFYQTDIAKECRK